MAIIAQGGGSGTTVPITPFEKSSGRPKLGLPVDVK
jgi:hypothetical protein